MSSSSFNLRQYPYTTTTGCVMVKDVEDHLMKMAMYFANSLSSETDSRFKSGWGKLPAAIMFPENKDYERIFDEPEVWYKDVEAVINDRLRDDGSNKIVQLLPAGGVGEGLIYKIFPVSKLGGRKRERLLDI